MAVCRVVLRLISQRFPQLVTLVRDNLNMESLYHEPNETAVAAPILGRHNNESTMILLFITSPADAFRAGIRFNRAIKDSWMKLIVNDKVGSIRRIVDPRAFIQACLRLGQRSAYGRASSFHPPLDRRGIEEKSEHVLSRQDCRGSTRYGNGGGCYNGVSRSSQRVGEIMRMMDRMLTTTFHF